MTVVHCGWLSSRRSIMELWLGKVLVNIQGSVHTCQTHDMQTYLDIHVELTP